MNKHRSHDDDDDDDDDVDRYDTSNKSSWISACPSSYDQPNAMPCSTTGIVASDLFMSQACFRATLLQIHEISCGVIPRNLTHRTGPTFHGPRKKPEYQKTLCLATYLVRGPLGFGPIQFLMDKG